MKKYYATNYGSPSIAVVNVDRETKNCVFDGKNRSTKQTEYHGYFDDFESAKKWVVDICKDKVEEYIRRLTYYTNQLEQAQNLTEKE